MELRPSLCIWFHDINWKLHIIWRACTRTGCYEDSFTYALQAIHSSHLKGTRCTCFSCAPFWVVISKLVLLFRSEHRFRERVLEYQQELPVVRIIHCVEMTMFNSDWLFGISLTLILYLIGEYISLTTVDIYSIHTFKEINLLCDYNRMCVVIITPNSVINTQNSVIMTQNSVNITQNSVIITQNFVTRIQKSVITRYLLITTQCSFVLATLFC